MFNGLGCALLKFSGAVQRQVCWFKWNCAGWQNGH
jgi:hypothetical protein